MSKRDSVLKASFLHQSSLDTEDFDNDVSLNNDESIRSLDHAFSDHFIPEDEQGEVAGPRRKGYVARIASSSTIGATNGSNSRRLGEDDPNEIAAEIAVGMADVFRELVPESLHHEYNNRDIIAPFQPKEISLGPKLGSGEFSHVYEIRCFSQNEALEPVLSEEQRNIRKLMKKREKYRNTKKACYAVKHLRQELITTYDKLDYAQAASDIAMEAEFLSSLQHPNIIKLRGISFAGPKGFQQGPKGFFLIIDRLDETLDHRLRKWERARAGRLPDQLRLKKKPPSEDCQIQEEQLDVCLRIAAALVYLHEKNIIFRDLKPANVGFDVRGDVKLFDFGLATIISPEGNPYEDTYEMSGAGSPRYMAPEVLKSEPDHYNLKADCYTFSIVAWQILRLQQPFSFVRSRDDLMDHVLNGGRPEIPESWPQAVKEELSAGFDEDMAKRPSMSSFYETFRLQLLHGSKLEDSDKFRHSSIQRRRSTFSIRRLVNQAEEEDEKGNAKRGIRAKLNKNMSKLRDRFKAGRRLSDMN